MWVRSQDRKILTNARHFEITEHEIGYVGNYIIFSNNDSNEIAVAKYSSLKKAMKVMDMLEKHINFLEFYIHNNTENRVIDKIDNMVGHLECIPHKIFQFPKDEEVILNE